MNGLGGLNKSPNGVVIGLVQLQLPTITTRVDVTAQAERIVAMVAKARVNMATMDLVVFPEYGLHGLSMDTRPEILCTLDGPEVAAFKQACRDNRIWDCFSIMEAKPAHQIAFSHSLQPERTFGCSLSNVRKGAGVRAPLVRLCAKS